MNFVKDILIDNDGDLSYKNGDFDIAPSDAQHIQHIVFANPGDYKQSPLVGFGIIKRLNSPNNLQGVNSIKGDLTLQLVMDGFKVRKIVAGAEISNLKIDAVR